MEAPCSEPRHVLIARRVLGAKRLEVEDALEEIGLPVPILAEDGDAGGGEIEIDTLEVAEISNRHALEPHARNVGVRATRCAARRLVLVRWLGRRWSLAFHFPLNAGARFSRNAFVPSRMSSVAARSPK